MSPVSPYQEPSPQSSGSGLKAPGGCLSKPTTSAISAAPAASIACAVASADPPVAQPLRDVDERHAGEPEHRHRRVRVAGRVGPAGGELHVLPADAGVAQRGARGDGGHLQARHALVAAERMDADPDDGDVGRAHACSTGRNAYVSAPSPPGAGTSTSSIGIPIRRRSGSASVSRASTRTSPGSST